MTKKRTQILPASMTPLRRDVESGYGPVFVDGKPAEANMAFVLNTPCSRRSERLLADRSGRSFDLLPIALPGPGMDAVETLKDWRQIEVMANFPRQA